MDFEYEGMTFTQEEVCRTVAYQGQLDAVLQEALRVRCMPGWAERIGVAVTEEQVQEFADAYRAARGLHEAQETADFLARAGTSEEDFAAYCQAQALRRAVRERVGGEEQVHAYFVAHRSEFDRARVSRIVVGDPELASELRMRVVEDGEDFHRLAREHSQDEETRAASGYVGAVRREDLDYESAARVFSAGPGEVVGPVAQGDQHLLYLVHEVSKARLEDEAREEIRDRLLSEWELAMLGQSRPA